MDPSISLASSGSVICAQCQVKKGLLGKATSKERFCSSKCQKLFKHSEKSTRRASSTTANADLSGDLETVHEGSAEQRSLLLSDEEAIRFEQRIDSILASFENLSLDNCIYFYTRSDPYYEFTNFLLGYPVKIDGNIWKTTEHFYQAKKFSDPELQKLVRDAETPRKAFNLVRNSMYSSKIRPDWQEINIGIMYRALVAKFTQHESLRELLLGTGNSMLVENSPTDSFWGNGHSNGHNYLGKLLVIVRERIRSSSENPSEK